MGLSSFMMKRVEVSGGRVAPVVRASPFDFPAVNQHTLICGSSGSGKSFLASRLFPSPDGLVLFKPDALFPSVPLASVLGLPSPFSYKPYDVADAYLYALGLDFSGIMASSLVPVIMSALSASRDLDSFDSALDVLAEDKVSASVVAVVRSHFRVLYPFVREEKKRGRPRKFGGVFPSDRQSKISFAGLGSFRAEFGAELFLRGLYSLVGSDFGTLLVDEFHHVARDGSIVDTLLREFRISGRLVAVSQSLSDVSPSMLSNFGYILLGRSVHGGDLEYLERLDASLPPLVAGLPPRVFLSLGEFLSDPSSGILPLYGWYD
jgi:hypothetical protein